MKKLWLLALCAVLLVSWYGPALATEAATRDEAVQSIIVKSSLGRNAYGELENKIETLIQSGDLRAAFDFVTETLISLQESLPLADWDGAVCVRTPEEEIFQSLLLPGAKVNRRYDDYPLLLKTLGWLLIEAGQIGEAEKYLQQAADMNPCYLGAWIELLNCALKASDFAKAGDILARCRELSVTQEDIALYYRRAGYIFYELGDSKMARAAQLYSLKFADSSVARGELAFLDQAGGAAPADYSAANGDRSRWIEEAARLLAEEGKAFDMSDTHRKALKELVKRFATAQDPYARALRFFEGFSH